MLKCAFTSKKWICWQVPKIHHGSKRLRNALKKKTFRQHWNKAVASIAQSASARHHWLLFNWVKPLTNWEEHQVRKIGFSWTILNVYIFFFDVYKTIAKALIRQQWQRQILCDEDWHEQNFLILNPWFYIELVSYSTRKRCMSPKSCEIAEIAPLVHQIQNTSFMWLHLCRTHYWRDLGNHTRRWSPNSELNEVNMRQEPLIVCVC